MEKILQLLSFKSNLLLGSTQPGYNVGSGSCTPTCAISEINVSFFFDDLLQMFGSTGKKIGLTAANRG